MSLEDVRLYETSDTGDGDGRFLLTCGAKLCSGERRLLRLGSRAGRGLGRQVNRYEVTLT